MLKWLFGRKINQVISVRNQAMSSLKLKLKAEGFDIDYPVDTSSKEYQAGAEIWIPMPEGVTTEVLINHRDKIRTISEEIALQFGLTAIGRGPVSLENALYFICCGFRRKPIAV